MKISVCSDLHLEFDMLHFGMLQLKNVDNCDVLILSGDILVARYLTMTTSTSYSLYREFFDNLSMEFPCVIYVAGNHEFYHGKWIGTFEWIRKFLEGYVNIHFLENQNITLNDVLFVGATIWTDMNRGDPLTQNVSVNYINDYKMIVNDARKDIDGYVTLRTSDILDRHRNSISYIKCVLSQNSTQKTVIVGHHAPSKLSVKPKYERDYYVNGSYSSDLSEIILDNPQIKLWTHGHTHECFDYMIDQCRIFCNPRGYVGREWRASEFKLLTVEV